MLGLRSGGWVLLLAAALVVAVVLWRLMLILPTLGHVAVGDGEHVESYGFDLSTLLVPRELLVAAGLPKDGLPSMDSPASVPASALREGQKLGGVRKLTDGDLVIGVEIAGQARAYPLWILNWHEVVNDTLAGLPIAVTYSALTDSAVVFDRRIDGQVLQFGVSGLLYNSNLVFFDRRPDGEGESLWSQLALRAIAGPAAARGAQLEIVPSIVVPWRHWKREHPHTTVILPNPRRKRLYQRDYSHYYNAARLHFPVHPLAPTDLCQPFSHVLAVRSGDAWCVLPVDALCARTAQAGQSDGTEAAPTLLIRPCGIQRRLRVVSDGRPPMAWLESTDDQPLIVIRSLWFAWYAVQSARSELWTGSP